MSGVIYKEPMHQISKSDDTSAQDILKQIGNHQFMQSDYPEYT